MSTIQTLRAAVAPGAVRQAFRMAAPSSGSGSRDKPPTAMVLGPLNSAASLVQYGAIDADPRDWFNAMRRADYGDTGAMIDLFDDARDRDSHLDGVVRKRVQSMMGRPVVFRPADGMENDPDALEIAANVRRILMNESSKFRSMLTHLMTGSAYGFAVSPLKWTRNTRGEYVPHLLWAHTNRFAFDRETHELGFYASDWRHGWEIKPLSAYPDAFVAHVPMSGRSDYPWRRGPIRSCIVPSFIKRKGLAYWLTMAERFGMPQPYAKVPKGLDHDQQSTTDTIAQVEAALQNLGRYWSAVFSSDIEIASIDGSGNVRADVHKALIDWSEMTQSIAMLGQNLTTKVTGGSFAATEAHRYVAADIHLADAVELGETLTQQVVEPLVRYNWPGAPVPVCEISTGQKQIFTTEHVKEGIASADELRRTLGHEPIPGGLGADYRTPEISTAAPTAPAAPMEPDEDDDEPEEPDEDDTGDDEEEAA